MRRLPHGARSVCRLRDSTGGFRISAARDFAVAEESRVLDPVSHMLEAMLALHEATGDAEALAGVRQIGDFLLYKMLQGRPDGTRLFPGVVRRGMGPPPAGWRRLHRPRASGRGCLSARRCRRAGPVPIYPAAAQRVVDYVLKVGYDESVGGCYSRALTDGTVTQDKAWWQQSGCLRMLMRFAALYGKPDMKRRYEQTLAFVREEFVDTANGGWYPRMKANARVRRVPTSSLMLPHGGDASRGARSLGPGESRAVIARGRERRERSDAVSAWR